MSPTARQGPELLSRGGSRSWTIVGTFGEETLNNPIDRLDGARAAEGSRRIMERRVQDVEVRATRERWCPGQHLIQRRPIANRSVRVSTRCP